MIAITISGQSRSRSSPPLSSMRFSSIFRVNYPLAIIFPWRSISMVSSGRRCQLSHLCELKRIQSSETSFGWAVYNVLSLISPQATISGADRPRAQIFTIFDQMNVTPRWEFLWVVNVNSAIIALSAPPPNMVNHSQWENKSDKVKGLAEFHCEFDFSSRPVGFFLKQNI